MTENPALKECVLYIETYSSYLTAVQFYMRHGMFQRAVTYILQQVQNTSKADVFSNILKVFGITFVGKGKATFIVVTSGLSS